MTLEELEERLPNGLHDTWLYSFSRSIETETAMLQVGVWTANLDDLPSNRGAHKDASIIFTGVKLFVVEPPLSQAVLAPIEYVWIISADRSAEGVFSRDIMERVGDSVNFYSFLVREWHSHIHVAASDIEFHWGKGDSPIVG